MKKVLFITALAMIFVATEATADGDFGSDMTIAISSLPVSPDLAGMGGLNITIPTTVGINPAQNGLMPESDYEASVYGEGYRIDFSDGPTLVIGATNASIQLGLGSLKLNYYKAISSLKGSKSPIYPREFSAESLELSYGFKLLDDFSLGASIIPYSHSEVEAGIGRLKLGGGEGRVEAAGSLGAFWRLNQKVNLAATWGISTEENTEKQLGKTKEYDVLTNTLRFGTSVQPWKGGTIGIEGTEVWVEKPGMKERSFKVSGGVEQYLNERFCLRAGYLNGGLTTGFGLALGKKKNAWIDYAYVANPVRMDEYWGDSSCHQLSFCVAW